MHSILTAAGMKYWFIMSQNLKCEFWILNVFKNFATLSKFCILKSFSVFETVLIEFLKLEFEIGTNLHWNQFWNFAQLYRNFSLNLRNLCEILEISEKNFLVVKCLQSLIFEKFLEIQKIFQNLKNFLRSQE